MGIIARQSIKASVVTYFGVLIGAFSSIYLIPKYIPAEYVGLISAIQRIAVLLTPFLSMGVSIIALKYYPLYEKNSIQSGEFVYSLIFRLSVSLIITSINYLLFKNYIAQYFIKNSPLLLDFLNFPLYVGILTVIIQFLSSISTSYYRIVIPNFLNNTFNKILGVITIISFVYLGYSLRSFVIYYLSSYYLVIVILLFFYIIFVIKPKLIVSSFAKLKENITSTFKYSLYQVFTNISGVIVFSIDTIMLSSMAGLKYTGIYAISYYIASVIEIPRKMLTDISFPFLSSNLKAKNLDKIEKYYISTAKSQLFVGFLVFYLIWFSIADLFSLMPNGSFYKQGINVVLFIGLSKVVDMAFGVNRQLIEVSDFYKYNLYTNILLAFLTIVFNAWLIPLYDVKGAAIATLLSIIIFNLISLIIVYIKMKILPFDKSYFFFVLFAICFSILNNFLTFNIQNLYFSIIVKSIYAGLIILSVGFYLNLLPIMNQIIKKYIRI